MRESNNLKQIGLAMHNYHDATGSFPPPDRGTGPKAKRGLSWRVHILPYIEQDALYREFKLDEPWDSEHNKKLIEQDAQDLREPARGRAPPGQTYYKVFTGKDAHLLPRLEDEDRLTITDGTSNTIMIVEGGEPVIWTKPDDISFDGKIDPKTLPLPGQTGVQHWHRGWLGALDRPEHTDPAKLAAAITRAGGETLTLDADDGPGEAVPFVVPKAVPIPTKPAPPKGAGSKPPDPVKQ